MSKVVRNQLLDAINLLETGTKYIGKLMFIEFRNRSGIKQCPFHARGINIINN